MIVVKFGGSSLAGPKRMLNAARIIARHRRQEPVVCVVSAMAGVTDQLFDIASLAMHGQSEWRASYARLRDHHEQVLAALATAPAERPALLPLWHELEADATALSSTNKRYERDRAIAIFSAWGERLAVRLFAAALAHGGIEATLFEDAPVIVERDAHSASPRWLPSVTATSLWLREPIMNLMRWERTPVLPGYLALTQDGDYTTLGRNGSDHSAALVAAALGARAVYIYSDVAGIYQADPRVVPDARLLAALTYDEAAAIAARGARVLHPATVSPLAQRAIPLHLRSALDPDAPGTDIGLSEALSAPSLPAETMPPLALMTLPPPMRTHMAHRKVGRPDAF